MKKEKDFTGIVPPSCLWYQKLPNAKRASQDTAFSIQPLVAAPRSSVSSIRRGWPAAAGRARLVVGTVSPRTPLYGSLNPMKYTWRFVVDSEVATCPVYTSAMMTSCSRLQRARWPADGPSGSRL